MRSLRLCVNLGGNPEDRRDDVVTLTGYPMPVKGWRDGLTPCFSERIDFSQGGNER
jgi:hypothetical protein